MSTDREHIKPDVTGVILDEELCPGVRRARLVNEAVHHLSRGWRFIERRWRFEHGAMVTSFSASEGPLERKPKIGEWFELHLARTGNQVERLEIVHGEWLRTALHWFVEEAEDPLRELRAQMAKVAGEDFSTADPTG